MAVVLTPEDLADLYPGGKWYSGWSSGTLEMYDRYFYDYATMYRTQPNVRTCVDFLSRNIAQLGLHWFRRVSDTDRVRLTDHPAALSIEEPLPPVFKMTRYRLFETTMGDLGTYFNAFWLKLRGEDGRIGLLPVPPPNVKVYGGLLPTRYVIVISGRTMELAPEQVVHFRGYNPVNPVFGLSPLETLRRVLAEEFAMGDYREHFWQNAARMGGIIERSLDAPEWSRDARERFMAEWAEAYSGGAKSGKTAILEDGMKWTATSFNAQQSEYLGGRKLTREECGRAYHIPLPLIGILDHATFSNIREQHRNLYQDCLGPWLKMLAEDIELQFLTEFQDREGVYCEFNIAEKLAGSFEEQTAALQSATGRPWMAGDEARARMNLPAMGGDMARPVTPLNVLAGGLASPRDTGPKADGPKDTKDHGGSGEKVRSRAPSREQSLAHSGDGETACDCKAAGSGEIDPTRPRLREQHVEKWAEVLAAYFRRQEAAIASRVKAVPRSADKASIEDVWRDGERWDRELGADLLRLNVATATVWAQWMAEQLQAEIDADAMLPWLEEHSRIQAENINGVTRDLVLAALAEDVPLAAVRHIFEIAMSSRAQEIARSAVTTATNFGSQEGARAGGMRVKTWQVNSSNPRPAHAAMDGETVEIGALFSNGMRWPGDPAGGADNNAGCQCSVRFGR